MMPMPSARSCRMISNRCSDSPAVSDEVGSSMMMMRALSDSALAISTICICPVRERETGVVGRHAQADALEQRRRSRSAIAGAQRARAGRAWRASLPRKMLPAMSRLGASISSWWMSAMPSAVRVAHAVEAHGAPVDPDLALVGRVRAAEDLHQRALARAVLAHQGEHFARAQRSDTPCSATTPGNVLVIPRISSSRARRGLVMRGGHVLLLRARRAASRKVRDVVLVDDFDARVDHLGRRDRGASRPRPSVASSCIHLLAR